MRESTPLISDLRSAFILSLFAIPLSFAIGDSAGIGHPASGLITAAVGGIIVGLFGGVPLRVSGPAVALIPIVAELQSKLSWSEVGFVTVCAGLIQLLLGGGRLARLCLGVSPSIIQGVLAGVGFTIIVMQLHYLMGVHPLADSALSNILLLPGQLSGLDVESSFLGLGSLLLLGLSLSIGKRDYRHYVFIATGVVLLIAAAVFFPGVAFLTIPQDSIPHLQFELIPAHWFYYLTGAVTIALIASTESLLNAVEYDVTLQRREADLDRELFAEGIGNLLCGLLGGFPLAGLPFRSDINVSVGARTARASVIQGLLFAAIIACGGAVIATYLARPVLAAFIVFVGLRLLKVSHARESVFSKNSPVFLLTFLGVVSFGALGGVFIGVIAEAVRIGRKLSSTRIFLEERGGKWHLRIDGSLTFLAVGELYNELRKIPGGAVVDIDLMVDFVDHAAFHALHSWRRHHELTGGRVDIAEIHEFWYRDDEAKEVLSYKPSPLREYVTYKPITNITQLFQGVEHFQDVSSKPIASLFQRLVHEGQDPKILFICCADSRVVPHVITSTRPGDLFVHRNIGNLVPESCRIGDETSVAATVAYALEELKVTDVIVCGHSECGAMKGLLKSLDSGLSESLSVVSRWLEAGKDSLSVFCEEKDHIRNPELSAHNRLAQINVVQQLKHLKSYGDVAKRIADKSVALWGWYYDIETARVFSYNEESGQFQSISKVTF